MKKSPKMHATPVNPVENSAESVEKPVENSVDNPVENFAKNPAQNPPINPAAPSSAHPAGHYEQQIAELTRDLQRTRADFENFRKQTDLQKNQAMAAARFATVEKFLPLVDNFSRAFASYPTELAPLAKDFSKLLQSLDLELIDSAPGTEFNPDFHDAVSVVDGDGDTEVVAETLRPGYRYSGSVLRPAMVKVTRA